MIWSVSTFGRSRGATSPVCVRNGSISYLSSEKDREDLRPVARPFATRHDPVADEAYR
jgi:hypothetical protein